LSRECHERAKNRKYQQDHRDKKKAEKRKGSVMEMSDDMSCSCSDSCTDTVVVVGSSSAREEQQQTTTTVVQFPTKKPEPMRAELTPEEVEIWLDQQQALHPDIDVRRVRDKLRAAGGDQTLQRLERWICTEYPTDRLPQEVIQVRSAPQKDCRFCAGTGWQRIREGLKESVVQCKCNGQSVCQEPKWERRDDGRWERAC
jgi:hypothetical protein